MGVQGKRRERTVQKLGIWVKSERERDTDIERERANQLANQLARETQFSYCPMCSLIIVCLVTDIERERARTNLRESGQESAHTPERESFHMKRLRWNDKTSPHVLIDKA